MSLAAALSQVVGILTEHADTHGTARENEIRAAATYLGRLASEAIALENRASAAEAAAARLAADAGRTISDWADIPMTIAALPGTLATVERTLAGGARRGTGIDPVAAEQLAVIMRGAHRAARQAASRAHECDMLEAVARDLDVVATYAGTSRCPARPTGP